MTFDYASTMPRSPELGNADIKTAKQAMRVEQLRQRSTIYKQYTDPEQVGRRLRDSFLDRCPLPTGAVIGGYWPISDEIDVRPLMNTLSDRGHPMAMPVVMNRQTPMRFRRWTPGTLMQPGRFGIPVPPETFPEARPDVLLVPLLAFDRLGHRLGRGSGFYDHSIRLLRATGKVLTIGIAFAGQEVAAVPHDPSDQRMDWIVTESYAFAAQSGYNPITAFGSLR